MGHGGKIAMANEACWNALGVVRHALEETLPSDWILSAGETTTIAAEAEELATAIRRLASVVPPGALTHRPDLSLR
jgi:hypothetical protein